MNGKAQVFRAHDGKLKQCLESSSAAVLNQGRSKQRRRGSGIMSEKSRPAVPASGTEASADTSVITQQGSSYAHALSVTSEARFRPLKMQ